MNAEGNLQKDVRQKVEQNQFFRFFQIFVWAHFFNFILFGVISSIIGGDGYLGFQKGEHYFVSEHGHHTEVPKQLYEFSKIHTEYTLSTLGICIFIAILLKFFTKYSPIKLSLKEWLIAAIVPLFWLITFLIVRY